MSGQQRARRRQINCVVVIQANSGRQPGNAVNDGKNQRGTRQNSFLQGRRQVHKPYLDALR